MAMDAVPLWVSPAMTELGDVNVSHAWLWFNFIRYQFGMYPKKVVPNVDNA